MACVLADEGAERASEAAAVRGLRRVPGRARDDGRDEPGRLAAPAAHGHLTPPRVRVPAGVAGRLQAARRQHELRAAARRCAPHAAAERLRRCAARALNYKGVGGPHRPTEAHRGPQRPTKAHTARG